MGIMVVVGENKTLDGFLQNSSDLGALEVVLTTAYANSGLPFIMTSLFFSLIHFNRRNQERKMIRNETGKSFLYAWSPGPLICTGNPFQLFPIAAICTCDHIFTFLKSPIFLPFPDRMCTPYVTPRPLHQVLNVTTSNSNFPNIPFNYTGWQICICTWYMVT